MQFIAYSKCKCGAITLETDQGNFSCLWRNRRKFFPNLDLRKIRRLQDTVCCDHCASNFGLDLCGCGSGNMFGYCERGLNECKTPSQSLM